MTDSSLSFAAAAAGPSDARPRAAAAQNEDLMADHYAAEAPSYYAIGRDDLARQLMEHRERGQRIRARARRQ